MRNRRGYIEKMRVQIAVWDTEIEKLRARCRSGEDEAEIMVERAAKELEHLRDRASAMLQQAEDVADELWDDLEDSLETAWHQLSSEARSVKDRLG